MKKTNKILILIILILFLISTVGLYLNKDNILANRKLNEDAIFIIYEEGEEVASYNMLEIQQLDEKKFNATLDTSSSRPKEYNYTGVLLKDIFIQSGITLDDKEMATVTGADNYTVALSIDKILEDDNIFLAYKREDKPLGSIKDGGSGPYQLIIRKDQFSQYWCKYALKADIK